MIITNAGVSVAGSAVTLAYVPAGANQVVITNAGASTLYVGATAIGGTITAGTVSTTTGTPVPASAVVPLGGFPSSTGTHLYGITAGGTVTAGIFISNAE